jgi:ABC-type transport system involved in Fe-S cluster assembly fused permease/ATPase subunit
MKKLEIVLGENATKKGVTRRLYFTKQELVGYINSDNRTIRDYVSQYAQKFPVISLSSKQGYLFVPHVEEYQKTASNELLSLDIQNAEHQMKELESRIKILNQRKKALKSWLEQAKNALGENIFDFKDN